MPTDKSLHLTVITPARAVLDTNAQAIIAPAFDGELGVLPGHAALLSLLGSGELRVTTTDGNVKRLAIRGGFLQINENKVTVLTPESIAAEDMKANEIDAELQKLANEKPTKLEERAALEDRQAWAKLRQKVAHGGSVAKH